MHSKDSETIAGSLDQLASVFWLDRVIPFWQDPVEVEGGSDRFLDGFGGVTPCFADPVYDIHGGFEPRRCRGLAHEFHTSFPRIEQHIIVFASHDSSPSD